jgi:hypothetical protein
VFGDYASGGMRIGGGRPSFPLLTQEESGLINTPYSQWAPAPYNKLNYSCMDRLEPMFLRQETKELTNFPLMQFLSRLRPLKAKLMLGMVPISGDRWIERKMDDPANYRNLFELMQDLRLIFTWYNMEEVQERTRVGFNWMVEKYVEFEQAANLRREQNGVQEKLDLAGMWAEYWNDTMSNMSDRTHQWVVDRVDEVQARAFAQYQEALKAAGADEVAVGEAGRTYYECVQDLRGVLTQLEWTLGIPMTGFKGYKTTDALKDLPAEQRHDLWGKVMGGMPFEHQKAILDAQDKAVAELAANPPSMEERMNITKQFRMPTHPRFRDTENLIGHYEEGKRNRDETRLVLCGPPKLPTQEHWITILRERMDFYARNPRTEVNPDAWGFVCYRLTYDQTDEQWAAFHEKFNTEVSRSGTWIEGYEGIRNKSAIMWIDGREVGIAEGDVAAARRHFKETFTYLPGVGRMWTQDFLVVDKQAYASYTDLASGPEARPPPPYGPGFGCNGAHVRLVDGSYDQLSQEMIDHLAPGYKGEMKVLSTLLLEEIYPLLATCSIGPFGLWPCARLHEREVYVGTTDASQEHWWEFNRIDRALMQDFFNDMRKKKADLLKKT